MASTIETGHAKNVATFEDFISFCAGYGAPYKSIQSYAKDHSLGRSTRGSAGSLASSKTAKTNYDNATNAREIVFKPLVETGDVIVKTLDVAVETHDISVKTTMLSLKLVMLLLKFTLLLKSRLT